MDKTYGAHADTPPEGMFCEITFPVLARLGERFGDGRLITAAGFDVRDLPQSVSVQRVMAGAHDGAVVSGSIDEVSVSADGVVSGKGWLLNDSTGFEAARLIRSGALTGNSINLAVEDMTVSVDPAGMKVLKDFTKSKFAGTTLVPIPAVEGAYAEIPTDVQIPAAADAVPVPAGFATEGIVTFAATAVKDAPSVDYFANPLLDTPTPVMVDTDGRVYGHLAAWGTQHLGAQGHLTPPRSRTDYAYFATGHVLTDAGMVPTGPLVIGGEHAAKHLGWNAALDHYAATSLAWADVSVGEDEHGIWFSGIIRPGTPDEMVHAGRASGLSGDWRPIGGSLELVAALSVNAPAFAIARPASFSHLGEVVSMTGAGMLAPRPEGLSVQVSELLDPSTAAALQLLAGKLATDEAHLLAAELATYEPFAAISPHSTATSGNTWDGPGNKTRVTSPSTPAYFARIFAWKDPSADTMVKAAYKFIHHFVSADGTPGAASTVACSVGIGVLNGGMGGTVIPQADRAGVHAHLAKHLTDAGMKPPAMMAQDEYELTLEKNNLVAELAAEPVVAALVNVKSYVRKDNGKSVSVKAYTRGDGGGDGGGWQNLPPGTDPSMVDPEHPGDSQVHYLLDPTMSDAATRPGADPSLSDPSKHPPIDGGPMYSADKNGVWHKNPRPKPPPGLEQEGRPGLEVWDGGYANPAGGYVSSGDIGSPGPSTLAAVRAAQRRKEQMKRAAAEWDRKQKLYEIARQTKERLRQIEANRKANARGGAN